MSHARWPGRLGQQGGVVELEGPGQLGKQGRAVVEQNSLTAREVGPAGQKLQLTFLVLKCSSHRDAKTFQCANNVGVKKILSRIKSLQW